jgi:CRISPR-associated protein Csd1
MGTAKLIGISNYKETYYGRFKKGSDIYRISYESSQKIHNMLKYLLENKSNARYIGENAYIVNWLSNDLTKGGIDIISDLEEDSDDDFEDVEETTMASLGGDISKGLGKYFSGADENYSSKSDFYILIIEKINDGRVSVKYFRSLSRSEAYERVMNWYSSTKWKFYKKEKSPSIYQIVNFIYGQENSKGYLSCENKKLSRSTIERLIPCIIDAQKIPRDIVRMAFYKLSNKQSYKKNWNNALNIGCSLIKKHRSDYEGYNINHNKISEVKEVEESRSFYYGKLMAIYEKIELDATRGRAEDDSSDKGKSQRITNSDRLWNSMIRTPERTRFILESKIKPYANILKKNNPGLFVKYDKTITGITLNIMNLDNSNSRNRSSLNEDFILGYYYQKNELYKGNESGKGRLNSTINDEEDKI